MRGLPKLVANVSSQFHLLVNTGLTAGSLVKWLPIKAAHTCKLDTIWVVYCLPMGSSQISSQNQISIISILNGPVITRGQFWPSGIVIACVCVSVRVSVCLCVCINHLLVRTITHQPFTLESPNLNDRPKTPWLRCLLFLWVIDLDLLGQI